MWRPLLILSPCLGTPEIARGYVAFPPLLWAPEKARVRRPLLILSPCLGTLEIAEVYVALPPSLGPREGRDEMATSDFVPLFGDP